MNTTPFDREQSEIAASAHRHTPGPWEVGEKSVDCCPKCERPNDWRTTKINVLGHPGAIEVRTVDGFPGRETYEVQDADARLIAAAPDLLAACEAIHKRFQGTYPDGFPKTLLRAALAKAKGGAQ